MALTFDHVIEKLRKMIRPGYLVGIPAMYLAGTAYHQGYLAGLGVNATLFPLGLNDTYVQAFLGTVSVLTDLLSGILAHRVISLVLIIVFIVLATLMLHRTDGMSNPQSPQSKINLLDKYGAPIERGAGRVVRGFWGRLDDLVGSMYVVATSTYFLTLALVGFLTFSVIVVAPYLYAGKAAAKRDLAGGFLEQPVVLLQTREQGIQPFSLVECGGDFCIAYSPSVGVVSVPKGSVTWVVSSKVELTKSNKGGAAN